MEPSNQNIQPIAKNPLVRIYEDLGYWLGEDEEESVEDNDIIET